MSLFPREHWFDMTHFFDDAFNSKRGLAEKMLTPSRRELW